MINETIRFLLATILFISVLFTAAALLTSCSELKMVECIARDNTRRPCQ
jgi:hypothetical protein